MMNQSDPPIGLESDHNHHTKFAEPCGGHNMSLIDHAKLRSSDTRARATVYRDGTTIGLSMYWSNMLCIMGGGGGAADVDPSYFLQVV